ncbi:MAG: hypothetical protein ICV75_06460 [Nitrospiraceae bacterium]|nr:hypothetical protein [Nitrospiraceae bacterium]
MGLDSSSRYLRIGRELAHYLGVSLQEASADVLRELARAYDPSASESRVSAEVFLLYKYLLVQACVGVFPDPETPHVVSGLCAALDERATGLEFDLDRQAAMERLWQTRAGQFDAPFAEDRVTFLQAGDTLHWKSTIVQFCQNVRQLGTPLDIWVGTNGPAQAASRSVTATLNQMVSAVGELKRLHLSNSD